MKAKTLERITQLENEVHMLKVKHIEMSEVLGQIRDYMTQMYFNTDAGKAEIEAVGEMFGMND